MTADITADTCQCRPLALSLRCGVQPPGRLCLFAHFHRHAYTPLTHQTLESRTVPVVLAPSGAAGVVTSSSRFVACADDWANVIAAPLQPADGVLDMVAVDVDGRSISYPSVLVYLRDQPVSTSPRLATPVLLVQHTSDMGAVSLDPLLTDTLISPQHTYVLVVIDLKLVQLRCGLSGRVACLMRPS